MACIITVRNNKVLAAQISRERYEAVFNSEEKISKNSEKYIGITKAGKSIHVSHYGVPTIDVGSSSYSTYHGRSTINGGPSMFQNNSSYSVNTLNTVEESKADKESTKV